MTYATVILLVQELGKHKKNTFSDCKKIKQYKNLQCNATMIFQNLLCVYVYLCVCESLRNGFFYESLPCRPLATP